MHNIIQIIGCAIKLSDINQVWSVCIKLGGIFLILCALQADTIVYDTFESDMCLLFFTSYLSLSPFGTHIIPCFWETGISCVSALWFADLIAGVSPSERRPCCVKHTKTVRPCSVKLTNTQRPYVHIAWNTQRPFQTEDLTAVASPWYLNRVVRTCWKEEKK